MHAGLNPFRNTKTMGNRLGPDQEWERYQAWALAAIAKHNLYYGT